MYHLELATPVLLTEQLKELAPQLGYELDTLAQIAKHKSPGYWIIK